VSFGAFGTYERKSCTQNIDEIDTWNQFHQLLGAKRKCAVVNIKLFAQKMQNSFTNRILSNFMPVAQNWELNQLLNLTHSMPFSNKSI